MRLTEIERAAITDAIHGVEADAARDPFGSRAEDRPRRGEIDLFRISTRVDLMAEPGMLSGLHRRPGSATAVNPDKPRRSRHGMGGFENAAPHFRQDPDLRAAGPKVIARAQGPDG
mgnify:FL=1